MKKVIVSDKLIIKLNFMHFNIVVSDFDKLTTASLQGCRQFIKIM
jgi:hypothetical protein